MFSPFGHEPEYKFVYWAILRSWTTRCLLPLAVTTLMVLPAVAQQNSPLTMAAAEDLALAAEPGQQALAAQAAALDDRAVIAGELPDPMLRLGLNNFPLESGGFRTEGMTNIGVGVQQVFPAGKTRAISAQRFGYLAAEMNENAAARGRNVLTAARTAWLDAYYWQKAHALVSESRPFFNDLATVTRSLYAVGRKTQQDVLRAELELSRLDDRVLEIERQHSGARAALGEWIGRDATRPLAAKLPDWNQVAALESLQGALLSHPTLQAADAQVEARDAGVDLAKQRSKPAWAVDLGYKYREGSLPSGVPRSDFISLGVTVGLPFFSKKSIDSTLSAALSERSAAKLNRERTRRILHSQLSAEHAAWLDLTRRLALYDSRILGQTRDNAAASLLAYQNDRGDFADVMRGYIDDLNTRIDHVRLQVERAKSYAVLANLGGLAQ